MSSDSRPKASSKSRRKDKGKARYDLEYDKERAWLLRKLQEDSAFGLEEEEGEGFECGCCFTEYPFVSLSIGILPAV